MVVVVVPHIGLPGQSVSAHAKKAAFFNTPPFEEASKHFKRDRVFAIAHCLPACVSGRSPTTSFNIAADDCRSTRKVVGVVAFRLFKCYSVVFCTLIKSL